MQILVPWVGLLCLRFHLVRVIELARAGPGFLFERFKNKILKSSKLMFSSN